MFPSFESESIYSEFLTFVQFKQETLDQLIENLLPFKLNGIPYLLAFIFLSWLIFYKNPVNLNATYHNNALMFF